MARIFVDTNVLFPYSVMDLMLALTEDAVHEVIWTETLAKAGVETFADRLQATLGHAG